MKRRGFFQALAGLCLAPFVPAVAAPITHRYPGGKFYMEYTVHHGPVNLNENWMPVGEYAEWVDMS